MFTIEISQLRVPVRVGCTDAERAYPQIITFDVTLRSSAAEAQRSDDLKDTVDYMQIISVIEQLAREHTWHLLEKLVTDQSKALLQNFSSVESVKLRATKNRFMQAQGISVSCELVREAL